MYLGVAMGKRVLYTTPLKALSNQKYNGFCAQFGKERVGAYGEEGGSRGGEYKGKVG